MKKANESEEHQIQTVTKAITSPQKCRFFRWIFWKACIHHSWERDAQLKRNSQTNFNWILIVLMKYLNIWAWKTCIHSVKHAGEWTKWPDNILNEIIYRLNAFESTNHIRLKRWQPINHNKIKCLVRFLPQLNIVHIRHCSVDGDLYGLILKHCKNNLKEFYFECSNTHREISHSNSL